MAAGVGLAAVVLIALGRNDRKQFAAPRHT